MKPSEFIWKWLPQFASTRFERPQIEADLREVAKEMMPEMVLKFMEWAVRNGYFFDQLHGMWFNDLNDDMLTTDELVKLWEEQK